MTKSMAARVRTWLSSLATKRLNRGTRGQAIIEFVVIFPMLIVLLASIIDFGIAMDRRITLQHAVREGSRYAAVHADIDEIKQKTVDQAQDLIDTDDVEVCYEDGPDANSTVGNVGDSVRVSASFTYEFNLVGPVLGLFGSDAADITLTPDATARLELSVDDAPECPPLPVPTVTPP